MLGQGKNNFPWHAPSVFCAGRSHRIIMFKEQSIRIIPSGERHTRDYGWLKTSWLFSFNDYQDRDNLSFGDLRAFNDDVVQPGEGFADHRHSEMEIVTFVLKGEISHQDSAGSQGTVAQDQVQRMSAGTGVIHSEFNRGSVPVHMYQIWFFPNKRGLLPSYAQGTFPAAGRRDRLQALASGEGRGGLDMSADATLYACDLGPGGAIEAGGDDRLLFMYVTDGSATLEGRRIGRNDQVRMKGGATIRSDEGAELIIIDMPDKGR